MIVPYISVLINIIACNCKLLCVWWLTKSIMLQSKHHQPTISFTVLFRLCKCDSTVYSRFISPKHNHNATQKMVVSLCSWPRKDTKEAGGRGQLSSRQLVFALCFRLMFHVFFRDDAAPWPIFSVGLKT